MPDYDGKLPLLSHTCTVLPMRNFSPAFFVALLFSGCSTEVIVENDTNPTIEQPDAAVDAAVDASIDASVDAAEDAGPMPPIPCHCPNALPCVKPMECCAVVGQCKDPAMFNCTGSMLKCP